MKILIVGGGTGGHIYPAIAIAQAFKKRDAKNNILFVGTKNGLEGEIVPQAGLPLRFIHSYRPAGHFSFTSFLSGIYVLMGFLESLGIILSFKPDLIISTGGYSSLPIVLAGWLLFKPIIVQEQNVLPGKVNRFAARLAKTVAASYEESQKYLPPQKMIITGTPIREEIATANREKAIAALKLDPDKRTVLILGGSQGAYTINQAVVKMVPQIKDKDKIQIVHITGKNDYHWVSEKTSSFPYFHAFAYLKNIADALAAADIVVGRAGAAALAEISAKGIPAILIPYPYAAQKHQDLNAAYFKNQGAAEVLKDKELSGQRLLSIIRSIVGNSQKFAQMKKKCQLLGKPDAAKNLVDFIYKTLRHKVLEDLIS